MGYSEDHETKLSNYLDTMKKIKTKFASKSLGFGWVDAICHSEIFFPFDLSEDYLPNFVTYSINKKQFSKMIGTFEEQSLTTFVCLKRLKVKYLTRDFKTG